MTIPPLQILPALFLLALALGLSAVIFLLGTRIGANLSRQSLAPARQEKRDAKRAAPARETLGVSIPREKVPASLLTPPVSSVARTPIPAPSDRARLDFRGLWAISASDAARQIGASVSLRSVLVEWAIVFVGVWLFSTGFLTLGTRNPLSGPEAEIFQSLDWVLVNNLKNFGEFPQWNPYILTGLPYVGDPFLHLYNPLVTLPVLVMGVWDGYKVGVFLSFVAAGLSAWYLGKVIGVGRVGRVWLALSYAFTGRAVAQFLQGQYDLIFSYTWIPLCLAGFIAVAETRRPFHVGLTALALALLFLSGNVYYAFYMLFVFALFGLVYLFGVWRKPLRVHVNVGMLRALLLASILALALAAVQLLPLADLWPQLNKQGDPTLKSSHTLPQIWLDYTSPEPEREDTKYFGQETYSYIGYVPFGALALLPLAWWKQKRRVIVFMLLSLGLAVLWASARETPLRAFFESSTILTQFRYPTRFLLFGALALLALTALGVDSVFQLLPSLQLAHFHKMQWSAPRVAVAIGAMIVLLLLMWSLIDVFTLNKRLAVTFNAYNPAWNTAAVLREFDSTPNYVQTPYNWTGALISNGLRNLGMFYGFSLNRSFQNNFSRRPVSVRPNYFILAADQKPNYSQPQRVLEQDGLNVYRLPESLPFAFLVTDSLLRDAARGELSAQDVTEIKPRRATANVLEFVSETPEEASLVVLMPRVGGWIVQVDGQNGDLRNVDGYLAVPTRVGTHSYTFTFDSWLFKLGLVISSIALVITSALIFVETFGWRVPRLNPAPTGAVL